MNNRRYKVREIAQQSGLSEATVDRVLNDRAGVRESTRAEVRQAISDLDKQRSQLRLVGRKFLVDVVLQTPQRFSDALRDAVERELPTLSPAVVRCRFHFRETESVAAMVETLDKFAVRGTRGLGTQGVIVKAPDSPEVSAAIDRLVDAGVPVVTYATDVPGSKRVGYVGIDNRAAGATAAYLMSRLLADTESNILVTLSSNVFRGEGEREMGFRSTLRELASRTAPSVSHSVVDIAGTDGLDATIEHLVGGALDRDTRIEAVYSIGGGNTATVGAFEKRHRKLRAFVAHDLDGDNRHLLTEGKISAVLHHDLRADVRLACRMIMQARGAMEGVVPEPSPIQVITPYNAPVT